MGMWRCPQALLEGLNKVGHIWPTCRLKLVQNMWALLDIFFSCYVRCHHRSSLLVYRLDHVLISKGKTENLLSFH